MCLKRSMKPEQLIRQQLEEEPLPCVAPRTPLPHLSLCGQQTKLENAIRDARAPAEITNFLQEADIVLTVKGQYRKMPKRLREAEARGLPIQVVRSNTQAQFHAFIESLRTRMTDDLW